MKLGIIVNMGIIDANGESQDNWIELDMSSDSSPITRDRIKDYSDVGLIYTPYSREFRVPASKTNNKAFKHWYNPKMYEGFDPRKKYEAMLKVNGLDWRKGYVKLNGVDLKRNQPLYYRIQFLGEMTSLRETLGNTELSDLTDLDELSHPYDLATVKDGMEAGLSISNGVVTKSVNGDIKYPFISHSRGFEFDEQGFHRLLSDQEKTQVPAGLFEIGKKYRIHTVGTTDFTEIGSANNTVGTEFTASGTGDGTGLAEYIVTNPDKLSHTDLKPAVRVNRILDAITRQFPSLVFNRDWLGSSVFDELFLWMHSEKGSIRKQPNSNSPSPQDPVWWGGLGDNSGDFWELSLSSGTEQRTTSGLRTLFQSSSSFQRYLNNTFTVTTPDSGSFSIKVVVAEMDVDGNYVDTVLEETAQGASGSASITFTLEYYLNIFKYYYVYFYVFSDDGIANFTPTIVLNKDANGSFGGDEVITYEGAAVSAVKSILPTAQMPKMKVFEFLQNLFRMFNLVAYEDRKISGNFEIMVEPLNDWLDDGKHIDITKYVSIDESKVDRVNPFSNIKFGFPDPKTFLAINQRQTTNDDWGDLEVNISEFNEGISQSRFLFDGGEYDISLDFEKMMFERLPNQDTNGLTKLQYGWAVNDNEENLPEPVLTKPLLMFIENQDLDYGGDVFIETLDWDDGSVSQEYNRPSNVSYTGMGQSIHFNAEFDEYTAPDGGALVENSLYKSFYERFIAGVFSNRASRRSLTAYLAPEVFLNYRMNDKFIVDGVDYQIEEVETNHRNGKSKLSLIRMTDEKSVFEENPGCEVNPAYPVGENVTSAWSFSLRRWYNWTEKFLRVRRSSDNAQTNVYFDGTQNILSLDNVIGDPTPTATTLGSWAGTDDVHVVRWYMQKEDGVEDANRYLYDTSGSIANEAKIIDNGNLIVNATTGLPVALFTGTSKYRPNGGTWGRLGGGGSCTLAVVAANTVVNSRQTPINTNTNAATSGQDRLAIQMDNRTTFKRMFLMRVDNVSYLIDQDNFNTDTDLQYMVMTKDSNEIRGWLNGTEQGSATAWAGSFEAAPLMVLGWDNNSFFTGEFFETFTTDQNEATAGNINEINDDLECFLSQ